MTANRRRRIDALDEAIRVVERKILFSPSDMDPRFVVRLASTRRALKRDLDAALMKRARWVA